MSRSRCECVIVVLFANGSGASCVRRWGSDPLVISIHRVVVVYLISSTGFLNLTHEWAYHFRRIRVLSISVFGCSVCAVCFSKRRREV